jgi:hypothetical protein
VRFTAANEHGDGNPMDKNYHDRQHTDTDVLGADTDGDLVVDSFFVDFNYLQRNAVINGMTATLLASGPETPAFNLHDEPTGLRASIAPLPGAVAYRVGVRSLNANGDFVAVYRTSELSFPIPGLEANRGYYISVAALDDAGRMGPFSMERIALNDADTPAAPTDDLPYGLNCAPIGIGEWDPRVQHGAALLPCHPNPTSGATTFVIQLNADLRYQQASIIIHDAIGRVQARIPLSKATGIQRLDFNAQLPAGVYPYSLLLDGHVVDVQRLVVLGE